MSETGMPPEIEVNGLTPEEAFAVLGNDIRLDIIRVLWNADAAHEYDDVSDTAGTLSFSALRRRVDVDDNGRFNYHLTQLDPHFVKQTTDGYRLSGAGKQIARTVIAVSGPEYVEYSAEFDHDCPVCRTPLTAEYKDQWLRISCPGCDGLFGEKAPDGAIFFTNYPAAGLTGRSPDEAFATGFYRCMIDISYMMRDVCRECAGAITASISVCEAHETHDDDTCNTCGTRFPVWAELRCGTCGFAKRLPVEAFFLGLAPVIGFLNDLDIDILAPSFDVVFELLQNRFRTAVDESPFRVTATIEGKGEFLSVTLDEDMNVTGVERFGRSENETG